MKKRIWKRVVAGSILGFFLVSVILSPDLKISERIIGLVFILVLMGAGFMAGCESAQPDYKVKVGEEE